MNAGFKRLFVGFITVPINTTYHQPHPFICHMKLKKEHFDYKPGKVWLKHSCLQEWHRDETPASVHFHPQQFYIISCIIIIQKKKKSIFFLVSFVFACFLDKAWWWNDIMELRLLSFCSWLQSHWINWQQTPISCLWSNLMF